MCKGRISKVAKNVIELAIKQPGFARHIEKVNIYSCENGNLKANFIVDESLANHNGTLHDAFSCFLLDNLTIAALLTHPKSKHLGISVSSHIEFLKSARIGEILSINATSVTVENSIGFTEMKIFNKKNGDLLVKGTQTITLGHNNTQ